MRASGTSSTTRPCGPSRRASSRAPLARVARAAPPTFSSTVRSTHRLSHRHLPPPPPPVRRRWAPPLAALMRAVPSDCASRHPSVRLPSVRLVPSWRRRCPQTSTRWSPRPTPWTRTTRTRIHILRLAELAALSQWDGSGWPLDDRPAGCDLPPRCRRTLPRRETGAIAACESRRFRSERCFGNARCDAAYKYNTRRAHKHVKTAIMHVLKSACLLRIAWTH
mmetsp:Transcript_61044/g.167429  ORF Transcript_61044/g.167429 Transcript_61044/m.167429 type:complete len:222 (+) Transcript_61044:311-976(+)